MFDPRALRLVVITDSLHDGIDGLAARAAAAVRGGATMLQLRLPEEAPRTLVEVARALGRAASAVPLVVNERADVALAAGVAGVHLGADGLGAAALRAVVPAGFVIGVSVGTEEDLARIGGADYVAIGPVFLDGGVPGAGGALGVERFADLARRCALPAVALGGVTPESATALRAAGASGVAAISSVLAAADPRGAARALCSDPVATGS